MLCRAVYVAIPVCVVGVVFITQPSWLGGGTHPRSALGIILAIGQVNPHTPDWSLLTYQADTMMISPAFFTFCDAVKA